MRGHNLLHTSFQQTLFILLRLITFRITKKKKNTAANGSNYKRYKIFKFNIKIITLPSIAIAYISKKLIFFYSFIV